MTTINTWNLIARQCRATRAAFEELASVDDAVSLGRAPTKAEAKAWHRACRAADAAVEAVRRHPVATIGEAAEKASLLTLAEDGHQDSLAALADDLMRLSGFTRRDRSGLVVVPGSLDC